MPFAMLHRMQPSPKCVLTSDTSALRTKCTRTHPPNHTLSHTHTHTHIYIYEYVCV